MPGARPSRFRWNLALFLTAIGAGACATQEPAHSKVADAIRDQLLKPEAGLVAADVISVECENDQPRAGVRMVCTVRVGDPRSPQPAQVDANYTSEDSFILSPKQAVVNTERLTAGLVTGNVMSAKCGSSKVAVLEVNATIDCITNLTDGTSGKVVQRVNTDLTVTPVPPPTTPSATVSPPAGPPTPGPPAPGPPAPDPASATTAPPAAPAPTAPPSNP